MKSRLYRTGVAACVTVYVALAGCSAPAHEPIQEATPSPDMGQPSDMPGEPEADPGLIARSGEVYTTPFGADTLGVFTSQDLILRLTSPMPASLSDAVPLDDVGRTWLVIDAGKLAVLDTQTASIEDSIISDYLAAQQAIALTRVDSARGGTTLYIHTDAGLHMWREDTLEKLEPTLHPTDMTCDGEGNLWVTTSDAVMALNHDGEVLRRRMVLADQGGDQIVALQGAMVMRQGDKLFKREQGASAWFEVVGVQAEHIVGHLWAPDLWWRDALGHTGHLYGDYMGRADGVTLHDGAAVDSYGRLITWDAASGEAKRHDRVHRVLVAPVADALTLPAPISVQVSFPERLDRLEATLDGQPLDAGMPQDASMTADVLVPASVGAGRHRLDVKAYFMNVGPPAASSAQFDAQLGDVTWDDHVEPIFKQYCASCHGVQNVYQLDTAQSWQQAAVPRGSTQDSFDYILSWLSPGNMPPGDLPKLTPAQITLLEQWRDQGFKE